MQNKSGNFLAENKNVKSLLSSIKAKGWISLTAHAEGEDDSTGVTPNSSDITRLMEDARKQEKEKLYPKIKKLEGELKDSNTANNELIKRNANLLKDVELLQKKVADLETKVGTDNSEDLEKVKQELEDTKAKLQELSNGKTAEELEKDIRAELEEEYKVKVYLNEQLSMLKKGEVIDYFMGNISGKTIEEVDESIQKAKEETLKVFKSAGIDENSFEEEEDEEEEEVKPKKKTKKVTTPSRQNSSGKQYTAEDIANMSTEEYAEFRKNDLKLK